ncbi:glutamate racemase [Rhodoferax koreense]|uniref:Glutamate racemase n=1 Tax=Rhodoferax koreensis TaxID=1842727 RepID=A0A1P8JVG1_9BURK|nr:glutamate racemase [Rhodoferax koreense]APW37750.1 glutamate racemase [Rhodoferax koreense]
MQPIGIFDSGIGGLSVLRALRDELPREDMVYLADSAHAPYGERAEAFVVQRALSVANRLRLQHGIKALVVACNTATAAAIHALRAAHPDLPIVGMEPALKPAARQSRTRRIGVMATRGTLASTRFQILLDSLAGEAEFVLQACDGLAQAIETDDPRRTAELCTQHAAAMGRFGTQAGEIDTLVLGCTHYPFARAHLEKLLGHEVHLIDTGAPVARQTRNLLQAHGALAQPPREAGALVLLSTGDGARLHAAARRWLGIDGEVAAT